MNIQNQNAGKMKAIVILFSFILIGCSQTRIVRLDQKFTHKGQATLITMDDEVINVKNIAIVKDRVLLREVGSDTIRYLQRSDINSFRIARNIALEYALIGGAGGAAWVVLTSGNWNDDNNAGYTFYWSAIYGGLTGGFGYLLGSSKTGEVTYTLQKEIHTTELDILP